MTARHRLGIAGALAALCGCANYATLQDPETVPKKEFQIGVGGTFTRYKLEVVTEDLSTGARTESVEDFTVPAVVMSGRYGATDRLELHGLVWVPLGLTVGGKYMVAGDRQAGGFAFSPGLDIGALSVTVNDESATLVDIYVPLQTGYRTSPGFVIYGVPKYILRLALGKLETRTGHVAGGTVGFAVGEKTQFLLEGSVLYDTLVKDAILQGALGVSFM